MRRKNHVVSYLSKKKHQQEKKQGFSSVEKQLCYYHDCSIIVPHDSNANFGVKLDVKLFFFQLHPGLVVWQFDTGGGGEEMTESIVNLFSFKILKT